MAYSYLNLKAPGRGRLNKAASTVLNPLSAQRAAPQPTPDYGQQMAQFMLSPGMQAPQFAAGTPNAASTGEFGFSNAGQEGFQSLKMPSGNMTASFGGQSVDYGNDPILQQIEAAVQAQVQQAQAAALGAERSNLIRYGSGDLVKSVLGDQADQKTIDAANANEFSTVKELGRWNDRALGGIDSNTNRNNLYFSSTRLRDRALQGEDYTRKGAQTANQLQDVLTGIAQNLLGVRQGAQNQLISAQADAYGRAMQQAMFMAQMAQAAQPAGGGPGVPQSGAAVNPTGSINGVTPPYASGPGTSGELTSYGNPYWQMPFLGAGIDWRKILGWG